MVVPWLIAFPVNDNIAWRLNPSPNGTYQTVDICLLSDSVTPLCTVAPGSRTDSSTELQWTTINLSALEDSVSRTPTLDFILKGLVDAKEGSTSMDLKLFVPLVSGFMLCSNTLQRRLAPSRHVTSCEDFIACGERIGSPFKSRPWLLSDLLPEAIGAVRYRLSPRGDRGEWWDMLEQDSTDRLANHRLVSPVPIERKAVALIGNRTLYATAHHFAAAQDLNFRFVVLADEGHWLQRDMADYPVEEFVPVDMTDDDQLVERLTQALQGLRTQVQGWVCFADPLIPRAARAARLVGIPGQPVEALDIALDKYAAREVMGGCTTFVCRNTADLEKHLQDASLSYPSIIKPVVGSGSGGTDRVQNAQEHTEAVRRSTDKGAPVVVEPYVDGPEFDANFFLWDNEVVFYELVDNFPTSADSAAETCESLPSFQETDMVTPSNLHEVEQAVIKEAMVDAVRKMGFSRGVFHTEGRVTDSISKYVLQDGTLDLYLASSGKLSTPGVFILEVNTRTPGVIAADMTEPVSGVDWSILHLLAAVGVGDRARALAQPFTAGKNLACGSVVISSPFAGSFAEPDIDAELIAREPELTSHVVNSRSAFHHGDSVSDPGAVAPFLGHFIVLDDRSRAKLVETMCRIRNRVRLPVERA